MTATILAVTLLAHAVLLAAILTVGLAWNWIQGALANRRRW